METVGSFEAKTHFSRRLDRVARGEERSPSLKARGGISGRGLEAIRIHCAGRVDEGKDGEDDVLGERSPGRAKAFETGVSRCQIV
jgi:hypothetical protein